MTTRLSVSIAAGAFSDPVALTGELVGALVSSSDWDGTGGLALTVQAPVQDAAPFSTWLSPLSSVVSLASSGVLVYAPITDDNGFQDLPPAVRFGFSNPAVAGTVVLILKSGCTVSVSC